MENESGSEELNTHFEEIMLKIVESTVTEFSNKTISYDMQLISYEVDSNRAVTFCMILAESLGGKLPSLKKMTTLWQYVESPKNRSSSISPYFAAVIPEGGGPASPGPRAAV